MQIYRLRDSSSLQRSSVAPLYGEELPVQASGRKDVGNYGKEQLFVI